MSGRIFFRSPSYAPGTFAAAIASAVVLPVTSTTVRWEGCDPLAGELGHDWETEVIRGEDGEEIDSVEMECPYSAKCMIPLAHRAYEGQSAPQRNPLPVLLY